MNSQTLDLARDLIVDIRCARRDANNPKYTGSQQHREELAIYAARCVSQLRHLYKARHGLKFNQFGWPKDIWS